MPRTLLKPTGSLGQDPHFLFGLMNRILFVLGLLALVVPASAQGYSDPSYGDPYARADEAPGAGVRVGVGVGASAYNGPQVFPAGQPVGAYKDVFRFKPAVTAEISFPLGTEQLRGRLLGGLLNIGADEVEYTDALGVRRTIPGETNPFLTSETILAEANLMYYLAAPGRSAIAPYIFSGLSGLFATGDAAPGVNTSVLAIPVGIGAEFALTRNLSFYGEAAYRFGLTEAVDDVATGLVFATMAGPCDDPTSAECKKFCDDNPNAAECGNVPPPNCDTNPSLPECLSPGGEENGGSRFGSALFTGGLRLGFNPAPRAYVPPPPPPYIPPPVLPPPPPVVPPAVCNLIELNPVYFDYGTSTISARARMLLNENVELLLANPECCVFIDGTIDNQEMDRFGMPLGGRRAQAVYDYYLSRGVPASKLQIRNRGEGSPNCDKEDPGIGCERNRRVETLPVDCDRFRSLLESPTSSPY